MQGMTNTERPVVTGGSPRMHRSGAPRHTRKPREIGSTAPHQQAQHAMSASKSATRLRVIPLGGLGEFGRNMMVIEYGKDMIVVDMGLMFPTDAMPGVDYVLPDVAYVKKNREKLRGVIITHGHLDHTGAVAYMIKEIGMPTVYGTKLTIGMIRDRLEEFHLENHVKLAEVHPDDSLQLGCFKLSFFRVNHNIPDSVGVAIKTPLGTIIHTGDWKFDHTPQDQLPTEFGKIARLGDEGVLLLCSDSTRAEQPGYCMSEKDIQTNLEQIFVKAKGRIIVSTFSSLVSRIQQVINSAVDLERKVAVSGMSMEKVLTLAVKLGYIKIPRGTLVKLEQIRSFPENKQVIISTGSQGQESSSLVRMSKGEHRTIRIQAGDTIILSSSPIPGNERAVTSLMNNLYALGANVVYNKLFDVHASGHAYREEMKLMLGLVRPKYFMPIHGERYMLSHHAEIAKSMGWTDRQLFVVNNGAILEFNSLGQARISPEKIDVDYIMVDGIGVGDVDSVILRDRQVLAKDGMLVIIMAIDREGRLCGAPDVTARGYVYTGGTEKMIDDVRGIVKRALGEQSCSDEENWLRVRTKIRDMVGVHLFKKSEKRPMVLPIIIRV